MAEKTDDLLISISTDLTTVRRALKRLETDIAASTSTVQKQFDGLGKGIDKSMTTAMQARIDAMVGIGTKATKEWNGALSEQGKELDRLRSKFSPVFSTISQYKTTVASIQQAHRLGAISADEMTAAISRERQAALSSIAAIKGRNAALAATQKGAGGFETSNIAAQFQDIAVTSAMGMSPMQIALQQGTQLSMVFEQMKASGQSAGAGLLAAFTSVISPISLATIGVVGLSAAAIQYFSSAGKASQTLDEILAKHEKNIRKLGPAYEEARKKAQEYATDPSVVDALFRDDIKAAERKLKEEIRNTLQAIEAEIFAFAARNNGSALGNRFAGADALIQSLRDGKIEIADFLREATALESAGKISPDAATALRKYAEGADDVARALTGMQPKVDETSSAFSDLRSAIDAIDSSSARKELTELYDKASDGKLSLDDLKSSFDTLSRTGLDLSGATGQIMALFKAAIAAKTTLDSLANGTGQGPTSRRRSSNPVLPDTVDVTPDRRVDPYFDEPDKKRGSAAQRDANAYRDLVKSAQDRIEQLRLEEQLVGKAGVSADAYRLKLELLQAATDKGRTIDEKKREELEKIAATYAKVAERVAALTMAEDLAFERQQMFRSPTEQRVFGQLRSAGIDPASAQGEWLAGQIRLNEQLAIGKDLAADFASGFVDDLLSGASAMDALANAAGRLGDKLLDIAMDEAINGLFKNLLGGGGGGGLLGSLFGGGGGFTGFEQAWTAAVPGLYSKGGYTGPGGKYQPAGIVHKGEYVFDADATKRIGVDNLRKLQGYAAGGLVGAPSMPRIQAPANQNSGPSMTYAPQIDARGASVEAVARLEQALARDRAEFEARTVKTIRDAQKRRVLR